MTDCHLSTQYQKKSAPFSTDLHYLLAFIVVIAGQ